MAKFLRSPEDVFVPNSVKLPPKNGDATHDNAKTGKKALSPLERVKARIRKDASYRKAFFDAVDRVATWMVKGGEWYGSSEEREAKRKAFFRKQKLRTGDRVIHDLYGNPVRPLRAKGSTPLERRAWSTAVIRTAIDRINSDPLRWGKDRVEFSARAVPGVKQGKRLNAAQLQEVREMGEKEFSFRVQTLYKYNLTASPEGLRAYEEWVDEKVDLDLPKVTAQPVNEVYTDDTREADSAHFANGAGFRPSRWSHVFLDGEPIGAPVVSWSNSDDTFDDDVDPNGRLRLADIHKPLGKQDVKNMRRYRVKKAEKTKRFSKASRQGRLTERAADNVRRFRQNIKQVLPDTTPVEDSRVPHRPLTRMTKQERVQQAEAFEERKRNAELALERGRERLKSQPTAGQLYGSKLVQEAPSVPTRKPKKAADPDDEAPKESIVDEKAAKASARTEERKAKKLEELSREEYERRDLLQRDLHEVLKHTKEDVPQSELELLEETVAYFHGEEVEDDYSDLDVDRARQMMPEFDEMLRNETRSQSTNVPKGLMGALAEERAKKGDRYKATLFTRGLAALEAAV